MVQVVPQLLGFECAWGATMPSMRDEAVDVVCLCAAWCRLCDAYAPVLQAVTSELAAAGARLRAHWTDIEDEADMLGDFDVQTFPTIVVIGRDGVRFAGPLAPQADTLRRLLRATVLEADAGTAWPVVAPPVQQFAARLRARRG